MTPCYVIYLAEFQHDDPPNSISSAHARMVMEKYLSYGNEHSSPWLSSRAWAMGSSD